jgi:glycerol-3-phosphate dehydrogenase
LERIDSLPNVWAELRWAARDEAIIHLDDLLLRRVRIGMLLPAGAADWLDKVRTIVQGELGWNDEKWTKERARYVEIWRRYYGPTPG